MIRTTDGLRAVCDRLAAYPMEHARELVDRVLEIDVERLASAMTVMEEHEWCEATRRGEVDAGELFHELALGYGGYWGENVLEMLVRGAHEENVVLTPAEQFAFLLRLRDTYNHVGAEFGEYNLITEEIDEYLRERAKTQSKESER